ncbi:MAG: ribonuclease P [Candidatus Thermoplasmatota archaeon]|uniref:ribonuclease P protein component 4 n=1 Tax=Ferroplasma sp. TaxID=2591003 RepID=UPI00261ED80D|nr:ribonuclease P [Ferroplasma sp.]MCL4310816.1 ribonuclease P [Candidatus Thermoplasmatota archaeon]
MKDQALIKISRERIDTLFNEAKNTENIDLARRYIRLMEKIGMRMNITIDRTIKRSYCKNCKAPYKDIRISLKNKMIVVHCPYCGDIRRIPFKKQKNNF